MAAIVVLSGNLTPGNTARQAISTVDQQSAFDGGFYSTTRFTR